MTTADVFLVAAANEYQQGHIDPRLWALAEGQSSDDKSLVVAAYLRARATVLELKRQERRRERRARRASPVPGTEKQGVDSDANPEILSAETVGFRLRGLQSKPWHVATAAGVLASVVAIVWLLASPPESESIGQPSVSAAAPSVSRSAPASPAGRANSGAGEADSATTPDVMVQQLKDAGNWNVLVLHASKWTRDQPNNAAAWNELSIGYANLRQFNDALAAAERAAELSPEDARLWRNLAHLNVTLERLPEAGSAFERALALSDYDADALCGAALVAHRMGQTKDADAMARRVKAADGVCSGISDGESVAVAVRGVPAGKPKSSVGR